LVCIDVSFIGLLCVVNIAENVPAVSCHSSIVYRVN